MKICAKCGEAKPVNEYSKHTKKRDGLQSCCKACNSIDSTGWYAANSGRKKENNAEWKANNPKKHGAHNSKWAAANPEARRIFEQNRRARKSGGKLTKGLAERLYKLQRGKCACGCKQPLGDDYHLDHRMPLALGGANEDWNMQLLTTTCNLKKNKKHPVDFMQQRGFLL